MFILGIRVMNFDSSDGKHIEGFKVYVAEPLEDGSGYSASSCWLSPSHFDKVYYTYLNEKRPVYAISGSTGKIVGFIPMA